MKDIISEIKSVEEESARRLKEAIDKKEKELSLIKQEMERKITDSEKEFKQEAEQRYRTEIENYKSELLQTIKLKKQKAIECIEEAEKNISLAVEFVVEQIIQNHR